MRNPQHLPGDTDLAIRSPQSRPGATGLGIRNPQRLPNATDGRHQHYCCSVNLMPGTNTLLVAYAARDA